MLRNKISDLLIPNFLGNKFKTTQRVSTTLLVTLFGGWALLIDSACLRDSASDPAWGLSAAY
jgi:hypothetical protein